MFADENMLDAFQDEHPLVEPEPELELEPEVEPELEPELEPKLEPEPKPELEPRPSRLGSMKCDIKPTGA